MALGALGAGPLTLSGQVIRNYENLDQRSGDDTYATVSLAVDGNTGNANYVDVDVAGALGFRGERHWLRLYPTYRLRRSGDRNTINEWAGHLRHSYVFSPALRSYAFLQVQSDQALDLDLRLLMGGGLRRTVLELGEGGVDVGVGAMLERERTADGSETSDVRGANLLAARGRAGPVNLTATGFFQPLLDAWADHRVALTGTMGVPLSRRLQVDVTFHWRRDTRPPPGIVVDDAGMKVGFTFSTR